MAQTAEVVNLAQFRAKRVADAENVVSSQPDILRKRYDFEISFSKEDDLERRPEVSYGPGARATFASPSLTASDPGRVVRDLFEVAAWTAENCFEAGDPIVSAAPYLMLMFDTSGRKSLRWPQHTLTTSAQHKFVAEELARAFEILTEGYGGGGSSLSLVEVLSAK